MTLQILEIIGKNKAITVDPVIALSARDMVRGKREMEISEFYEACWALGVVSRLTTTNTIAAGISGETEE